MREHDVDDATIYDRHRAALHRYATALIGPTDAEDVVSAVVTRVIERKRGLTSLEEPLPYLLRAILNEVRDRHRRTTPDPLPDEWAGRSDPTGEVLDALWRLPARQRAVLYLHYWERSPVKEIARTLGVAEGSVKRYLHLGRRRLKGALQ